MLVGAFGDTVFEVSNFKALTFRDFQRKNSANFAEHKIVSSPAVLEFLGRDLETFTMTITLHSSLGVDPFEETNQLRDMLKTGEPNFLIIGNHAFGENEFVITDLSEKISEWNKDAQIAVVEVDVTFKEYVTVYEDGEE